MGILDSRNHAAFRSLDISSAAILLPWVWYRPKRIQAFCILDNCRYRLPWNRPIDWGDRRESSLFVQAVTFLFGCDSFPDHSANKADPVPCWFLHNHLCILEIILPYSSVFFNVWLERRFAPTRKMRYNTSVTKKSQSLNPYSGWNWEKAVQG